MSVIALPVAASLLVIVPSGLSKPTTPPELRSLKTLWQEYPLETKRQPIDSRPVRVKPKPAPHAVKAVPRVNAAKDKSSVGTTLGIALAALALLLFTLLLTRRFRLLPAAVHVRQGGAAMPMFGDRKPGRTTPESERLDHPVASRISTYKAGDVDEVPSAPVTEPIEQTSDYAQLGEHVSAILEAAEVASKKMKLQATEAARKMRVDGEHQARVALEEAKKQARQIEAEAALLEAEAEKQSTKIRKEAETYAGTTRETADKEAAEVMDRAQRQASDRIRATRARLQTLDENVAATELRLRQLVGKLRELASSLDDLVSDSALPDEPETEPVGDQEAQGSLTDALTQSVAESQLPATSADPL